MIQTKSDLKFYIAADRIMNGFTIRQSIKEFITYFIDKPVGGALFATFEQCELKLIIKIQ